MIQREISDLSSTSRKRDSSMPFLSKYQVDLPLAISSISVPSKPVVLSDHFQVGPRDVVCGRGRGAYNRPGNQWFRRIVQERIPVYVRARTKVDKSVVISSIIDEVRDHNDGRFVKQRKDGSWYEIGEEQAREKVGHTIREAIAAGERATYDAGLVQERIVEPTTAPSKMSKFGKALGKGRSCSLSTTSSTSTSSSTFYSTASSSTSSLPSTPSVSSASSPPHFIFTDLPVADASSSRMSLVLESASIGDELCQDEPLAADLLRDFQW